MDAYPSLTYRDVDSALEFLGRAFGLEPLGFGEAARHPEGNLWSFGYQRTESEG